MTTKDQTDGRDQTIEAVVHLTMGAGAFARMRDQSGRLIRDEVATRFGRSMQDGNPSIVLAWMMTIFGMSSPQWRLGLVRAVAGQRELYRTIRLRRRERDG